MSSFIDMKRLVSRWLPYLTLTVFLLTLVLASSGCSTTTESENLSSRPWNTPKSWQNGMPTGMFEGR
jgi:hypothetical protein